MQEEVFYPEPQAIAEADSQPKPNGSGILDPSQFIGKKATTVPAAATKVAPLNPADFVSQSVPAAAAGSKKTTGIQLVDPKQQRVFFRVRPGAEWHLFGVDALFPEGSDVSKAVLISPTYNLPAEFSEYVRPANLFLIHDQKGATNFYVFPDSQNSWHVSRYEIAIYAETNWVKMMTDRPNNCYYEVLPPEGSALYTTEPVWPEGTFSELFNNCFKEKIITSDDDPILKRLSGMTYGK